MSQYEQKRIDVRRILLNRLLEIENLRDDEVKEAVTRGNVTQAILDLSKYSWAERASNDIEATDAANADKFLYGKDELPE